MDLDGSGYITEKEVLKIGTLGLGESITAAKARWEKILAAMDSNHDNRVSRREFVEWMHHESGGKIQQDGTFVPSDAASLLRRLEKLKESLQKV